MRKKIVKGNTPKFKFTFKYLLFEFGHGLLIDLSLFPVLSCTAPDIQFTLQPSSKHFSTRLRQSQQGPVPCSQP